MLSTTKKRGVKDDNYINPELLVVVNSAVSLWEKGDCLAVFVYVWQFFADNCSNCVAMIST